MRVSRLFLVCLCGVPTSYAGAADFPDFGYRPPSRWTGRQFALSQEYPTNLPPFGDAPWTRIDFRSNPREYMNAVIAYCFEGNLEAEFDGHKNLIRKWYHAPWLHWGPNGREFVRGLTRERLSRKFELAATQTDEARNFAVGLYNPRGGYSIGKVWKNPNKPDYSYVRFPEGTVTFKLLFTTASVAQVPYLNGAPEWVADVDRSPSPSTIENSKVRLLQIDIAVRDFRSSAGGWIFGTFHYDSAIAADSPWRKLRPLTLMWGDDPALTPTAASMGQSPVESWVNEESPIVQYRKAPPPETTLLRTLGWAGRGNGPVDNPVSSCISCHSTAQWPSSSPIIPPSSLSESQKLRWFRNLAPGEAFDPDSRTLDFSLQVAVGIQNLEDFQELVRNQGGYKAAPLSTRVMAADVPTRRADTKADAPRRYRFSRDPDEADPSERGAIPPP